MKRNGLYSALLTVLILAFASVKCNAQDWTHFRGPNGDCRVSGFKAPASWPASLNQVWKVTVGTGDASPVLFDKKLYLNTRQGDNEVVLCLDALTGKEVWKESYASDPVTGPAGSHPGPRSTPSVGEGKVVTFGVAGILSCFDAATGKLLWRRNNPEKAVPDFFAATSPLIMDGNCYIFTGKKDNGAFLCLDLARGNEKWRWTGEGPAYSSPSVMQIDGRKQIVILSEKSIFALDAATGKLAWKIESLPKQRFYNSSSPVIDGQTLYLTGQGTGTKAVRIVKEGTGYTPKELWTNSGVGTKWNTPVLHEGNLYGFSDSRKIFCISSTDGNTAWVDNTVTSDFATLLDCGSILMGLPSTGFLIILKPDNKAYTEVAKYRVAETPVYAFPLVAGNAVYVKDAESLTMYTF